MKRFKCITVKERIINIVWQLNIDYASSVPNATMMGTAITPNGECVKPISQNPVIVQSKCFCYRFLF